MNTLLITLLLCAAANAQEESVTVPKKYVSAEGLQHTVSSSRESWIGIGKEIGIATREGLNAVVDTAEKFGTTKVGTFVMVLVAWKIIGKDVLGVVLGLPLLVGGVCIWMWALRRLFFGYRVVSKIEGKTKFYEDHPPYEFDSNDARGFIAAACIASIVAFVGLMIFKVIF